MAKRRKQIKHTIGDIDGYFLAKEAQKLQDEEGERPVYELNTRFRRQSLLETPKHGLIKELREKLNIPLSYIADELGAHKQAVALYEKSEKNKTITIATLDRVAKLFGLKLVYNFVPEDKTLLENVRTKIKEELSKPEYTHLFKGVHASKYMERRERLTTAYINNIPKSFWRSKNKKQNKKNGKSDSTN